MAKLDELKQLVADAFKEAEDKESIDTLAKINNTIEDVRKEANEAEAKRVELLKSYKDLVNHTSFQETKVVDPVADAKPVSLEDALSEFIKNK